nr:hypothetical protein [Tanacetum cinerariifolium]
MMLLSEALHSESPFITPDSTTQSNVGRLDPFSKSFELLVYLRRRILILCNIKNDKKYVIYSHYPIPNSQMVGEYSSPSFSPLLSYADDCFRCVANLLLFKCFRFFILPFTLLALYLRQVLLLLIMKTKRKLVSKNVVIGSVGEPVIVGTRGSSLCHVDEGSEAFVVKDNDLGCLAGRVVNDVRDNTCVCRDADANDNVPLKRQHMSPDLDQVYRFQPNVGTSSGVHTSTEINGTH